MLILAKADFGYPLSRSHIERPIWLCTNTRITTTQPLRKQCGPFTTSSLHSGVEKGKPVSWRRVETPLLLDGPRSACSASNHTADAEACRVSLSCLEARDADNPLFVQVEQSYLNCHRCKRPNFLQSSFSLRHENAPYLSYAGYAPPPKGIHRPKRRRKR